MQYTNNLNLQKLINISELMDYCDVRIHSLHESLAYYTHFDMYIQIKDIAKDIANKKLAKQRLIQYYNNTLNKLKPL